jgi:hypothetical protein
MKRPVLIVMAVLALAAGAARARAEVPADVAKLLHKKCAVCHKGKTPPQGLSWEAGRIGEAIDRPSRESPDEKILDTTDPAASYMLKKIRRDGSIKGKPMPPLQALAPAELELLESWVTSLRRFPAPSSAAGAPGAPTPAAAARKAPFDTPAFFGTTLINLPTTTTPDKGDILVRISHRFSDRVEEGFDDFFGFDSYANILLGVGYGVTDRLAVSIGRARTLKEFELAADWLIAEQGRTAGLPFSATLHGGASLATDGSPDEAKVFAAVSLSVQATRRLSFLAVPSFASNANSGMLEPEGTFAVGLGARYMIFKDFSFTVEWVPVLAGYKAAESGWGLGIEKKIGGHVFQVFVNNALGLTPAQFLPGGDLRLGDFDFRIGFNIYRTF